jgi:hypothetical protein
LAELTFHVASRTRPTVASDHLAGRGSAISACARTGCMASYLVTGASSGIGEATALRLDAERAAQP